MGVSLDQVTQLLEAVQAWIEVGSNLGDIGANCRERSPAVFSHPSGVGTMRASALRVNTLTWTVQITDVNTRVGDLSR